MAIINHTKDLSSIVIKGQLYLVFGNLDIVDESERVNHSFKVFYEYFKTINEPAPEVVVDWYDCKEDDWVLTHDLRIIQILKYIPAPSKTSYNKAIIRTCVGTFAINNDNFFDSDFELHKDRYRISSSSKSYVEKMFTRKENTKKEDLYCELVAKGDKPENAYMKSFRTSNKNYAKAMSGMLSRQERIHSKVSDEVEKILEEEGVSKRYIVQRYKELIDDGLLNLKDCSGSVRAALKDLADMSAMMPDKNKNSQMTKGVFEEISEDKLSEIEEAEIVPDHIKEIEKTEQEQEQEIEPPHSARIGVNGRDLLS